jgi:DNA-binding transcriptional LysR family regulator
MKPRINLDKLLLFYEVVNAQSINKAAEKLGIPKSTISRKLSELEATLDAMLVKRGNRGLLLTEVGQLLYDRCGRIMADIEEVGNMANSAQGDLVGRLRVSLPMDFWMSWFGQAVSEFATEHSGISMELLCHDRFVDVLSEPYDIAIHIGKLRNSNLTVKPLGTLSRGFHASPAYIKRRGNPKSIKELIQHDPIVMLGQDNLWDSTDETLLQETKGRFVVNSIGFARELALNGQGVAVLPNVLCAEDIHSGRLVRLLPSHKLPPILVSGSFISRKHMPRKTRAFLDFVAKRLIADVPS